MRKPNVTAKLFRLLAILIVIVIPFSQVTGVSRAGNPPPKGMERVDVAPVSLDEVQNYYGALGGGKGPLGIVVELKDQPAALIFAQSSPNQTTALTTSQLNIIQQKQAAFMQELLNQGIQATELFRTQKVYNGIWMRVDAGQLDAIASMPGVKAIHPIIPQTLDLTTSVPLINAPQVWGGVGNYQGEAITIGVIDTGIDYIHVNFGGSGNYAGQDYTRLDEPANAFPTAKVVGGWDFVGDAYNADPNSPAYNPVPAPDPDPMDCYGHGSHVAGIAAGFGVNSNGTTYQESGPDTYAALKDLTQDQYIAKFRIGPGVAPKALLYSLRIFGCAGSTDVTTQAIEWAMDPNNDGNLSDHLDVINMSLGSPFGSEYDPSAVASNNAAQAGVIVVASAGNNNDVYYITSSPAVATNAISVASNVDSSSVYNAFSVTANTAPSPQMPPDSYPAMLAAFGPLTYSVTANLAYYTPTDLGCNPSPYPAAFFLGKIALINRDDCTFVEKVKNAQNAGALGVLMVNTSNALIGMSGSDATITIPSMMTTLGYGNALRTDMAAGTVTIKLSSSETIFSNDPTIVDTISTFSSRGPARAGTNLKPDITAPGDTIFSTRFGTGNEGVSFSGTSMSSPHVAGVMALLKELHPTWTVADLKALVMNTATHDLWTSPAHTQTHTPTRVGAGRVDAAEATLSPVIAFNTTDPGAVSLSFGAQAVLGTQNFVKSLTIKNTGGTSADYNVDFDSYYPANPGLTFSLLTAGDAPLSNPVTIPAGGTLEIKVKITIDALQLLRTKDASVSTAYGRQYFGEGGGYVTMTSTATNPTLRVPVHIAARPASNMSTVENQIELPSAATGTFNLTPTGTPVDTADDVSLVSILELKGIDPNEPLTTGINDDADLHYIGVTSDYTGASFSGSSVYFGIATYGKWDTSNSVEFDIFIDVNEDGIEDYVVFNANLGFFNGTTDDVMLTAYCNLNTSMCAADWYTNAFPGGDNTNLFNNNVILMPVGTPNIGLQDGTNTDFDFYVVSYSRDGSGVMDVSATMSYDVAHPSFIAVDSDYTGIPMWLDAPAYSPAFQITYDKAAIAANHTSGLLLLHHHNDGNTAQVVELPKISLPFISKR